MNIATQRLEQFAQEHELIIRYGEEGEYPVIDFHSLAFISDLEDELESGWLVELTDDIKARLRSEVENCHQPRGDCPSGVRPTPGTKGRVWFFRRNRFEPRQF